MLPTSNVIAIQNSKSSTKVVKADNVDDELPERVTNRQPRQPEVQRRQVHCYSCSYSVTGSWALIVVNSTSGGQVTIQLENTPRQPYDDVDPADDHVDCIQLRSRRLDRHQHCTGVVADGWRRKLERNSVVHGFVTLVRWCKDVNVGESKSNKRRNNEKDGSGDEVGSLWWPVDDADVRVGVVTRCRRTEQRR